MFYSLTQNILDLCCGVGSLGIEALSRGGKTVKFVDRSKNSLNILVKNIEILEIKNYCQIVQSDAIKFLKTETNKYDIIFADPPYRNENFYNFFPTVRNLLNKGGYFIHESEKFHINSSNYKIKYFGNTQLTIWKEK